MNSQRLWLHSLSATPPRAWRLARPDTDGSWALPGCRIKPPPAPRVKVVLLKSPYLDRARRQKWPRRTGSATFSRIRRTYPLQEEARRKG